MEADSARPGVSAVALDLGLVALAWLLIMWLVDARGEFPVGDDWAFSATVRHLLDTGEYRPTGWSAMALLLNVMWGALFCLPAGFSYEALRLSGVVAGLIGLWALYSLCLELGARRRAAGLAVASLALCPLYVALAPSFHTDVPCTALLLLAARAGCRYLRLGGGLRLLAFSGLCVMATLSRQVALALPLSVLAVGVLQRDSPWRQRLLLLLPLLLSAAAFAALKSWLAARGTLPQLLQNAQVRLLESLQTPLTALQDLLLNGTAGLLLMSLLLLPLILAAAPSSPGQTGRRARGLGLLLFALLVLRYWRFHGHLPAMPIFENVISRWGIGGIVLRGMYLPTYPDNLALPPMFWHLCEGLAFVATVLLLWRVLGRLPNGLRSATVTVRAVPVLTAAILVIPVLLAAPFDRYLLPSVALLLAVLATLWQPPPERAVWTRPAVLAALCALGFFGIAGTRDLMHWQALRWQLADTAIHAYRATPATLDGGFEFNGMHLYDVTYLKRADRSWYWVADDEFVISMLPQDGWHELTRLEYRSLLSARQMPMILQQRNLRTPP